MDTEIILTVVLFLVLIAIETIVFRKWMFVKSYSLVKTERMISVIYVIHVISSAILLLGMASTMLDMSAGGSQDVIYLYLANCLIYLTTLYFFLAKTKLEEGKRDKQFKRT